MATSADAVPRIPGPGSRPIPDRSGAALRTSLQIVLAACAIGALLWILHRVQGVFLLLVLSVLFAYLVAPVVAFFGRPRERRGRIFALPPPLAIGAAYLLIFGTAAGFVALLLPVVNSELAEFRGELPAYVGRVEKGWQDWQKGQNRLLPREMRSAIDGLVNDAVAGTGRYLRTQLLPMVGNWILHLPWLVLVPILAFFLLRDADRFRQSVLGLFPRRRLRWRGDVFFEDVNRTLAGYIRAQLFAALVMALICAAGFLLLGVPYGLLLAVVAGLLECVPLVGPLVIATVATTLTAFDSSSGALAVALFLIVVRVLQDYVIYPKLVGREMPLHPMAVILAILCGGEIAGLAGIFLAVPVLAVCTVAFRHWRAARRAAASPRPAGA